MRIKQPNLRNRRRAHEASVLVELRASLHAAAAGNAARKRISGFLVLGRHARTGAQIVRAIDRDPRLYRLEIFEDHAAVGRQVADDGELRERLQPNWLLELVNQ